MRGGDARSQVRACMTQKARTFEMHAVSRCAFFASSLNGCFL